MMFSKQDWHVFALDGHRKQFTLIQIHSKAMAYNHKSI
jgi:hypothetical protein